MIDLEIQGCPKLNQYYSIGDCLQKMNKLKADQEKKCVDFQTMDGAKMLELKEECGK